MSIFTNDENARMQDSVCERLSGREKAGKLECCQNINKQSVFKDVHVLLLKEPTITFETSAKCIKIIVHYIFFVEQLEGLLPACAYDLA